MPILRKIDLLNFVANETSTYKYITINKCFDFDFHAQASAGYLKYAIVDPKKKLVPKTDLQTSGIIDNKNKISA